MQAAFGRNTSDMQAALGKYDLHFENAIDMKPACRLSMTP